MTAAHLLTAGRNHANERGALKLRGRGVVSRLGDAPAGPAVSPIFARDVSQEAHGATTSTARPPDRESGGGGESPPTRKAIFRPGPDDSGAYCYRCGHMVLEPCNAYLCPMQQEDILPAGNPNE